MKNYAEQQSGENKQIHMVKSAVSLCLNLIAAVIDCMGKLLNLYLPNIHSFME